MTSRYEIDSDNAVNVYEDGATVPSLYQPHWPNGDFWADAAEAEAWAQAYVASLDGYPNKYAPNSRGEQGLNQPSPEQADALQAAFAAVASAADDASRQVAQDALNAVIASINPQ